MATKTKTTDQPETEAPAPAITGTTTPETTPEDTIPPATPQSKPQPAPARQTMVRIRVLQNRLPIDGFERPLGKTLMIERDRAEILETRKLAEIIGC